MRSGARPAGGARDRIRVSLAGFVLLATAMFLLVGVGAAAATGITGQSECSRVFLEGPGLLLLVLLGLFEFSLARMVAGHFAEDEPLRPAWFLIMLSGGCHVAGALATKLAGIAPELPAAEAGADTAAGAVYRLGAIVGGPLQMAAMAAALWVLLRVCRRQGLAGRTRWFDGVLLAAALAGACFEASRAGRGMTAFDALAALEGPLLAVLAVEALLVKRYMTALRGGMIAKCWMSIAAAILLTALRSLGLWAAASGLLPDALAGITWYIWFLAAMAYALGPAWQIEAIESACGEVGIARFSPFAASLRALRLIKARS